MQASPLLNISLAVRRFKRVRANLHVDNTPDACWQRLVTTGRFATHSILIGILLVTSILVQNATARWSNNPIRSLQMDLANVRSPRLVSRPGASHLDEKSSDGDLLIRQFVASTTSKTLKARYEVITYTVQAGDTTESIAVRFGLQPSSLIWSNKSLEDAPDRLSIGQQMRVPPTDGLIYEVQTGDALSKIAEVFRVKQDGIVNTPLNQLNAGSNLVPGMQLFVPKGMKQVARNSIELAEMQSSTTRSAREAAVPVTLSPSGPTRFEGAFVWPTQGAITQGFFWGHGGLDIANAMGVPVMASESGVVRYAGWDESGYGWLVELDHGNGFTTLYAHLSEYPVVVGQSIARGQLVGLMGSSGRSTGPHTHFEIRYNGIPQNPLFYLP